MTFTERRRHFIDIVRGECGCDSPEVWNDDFDPHRALSENELEHWLNTFFDDDEDNDDHVMTPEEVEELIPSEELEEAIKEFYYKYQNCET